MFISLIFSVFDPLLLRFLLRPFCLCLLFFRSLLPLFLDPLFLRIGRLLQHGKIGGGAAVIHLHAVAFYFRAGSLQRTFHLCNTASRIRNDRLILSAVIFILRHALNLILVDENHHLRCIGIASRLRPCLLLLILADQKEVHVGIFSLQFFIILCRFFAELRIADRSSCHRSGFPDPFCPVRLIGFPGLL